MAILVFSGDFVASQFSLEDNADGETDFFIGETPFLATDIVRIEIDDADILPDGGFDPNEVNFLSFSVERGGIEYDFGVNAGSKIKESGGGSNAEQGDTYFLMNDSVSPPESGPFSGLDEQTYLFSIETSFSGGPGAYTLAQTRDIDFNADTDFDDPGEAADSNFNVQPAVPCFTSGTLILTPDGEVDIASLQVGDLVVTMDRGPQQIRFIWRSEHLFPGAEDRHLPILFNAGCLAPNVPSRDLAVSSQHHLLLNGADVEQLYGRPEVLAPAKGFLDQPGIRIIKGIRCVKYFHLLFDHHEVVFANGTLAESLYPGPTILRDMSQDEREALFAAKPKLKSGVDVALGEPARLLLRVQETRRLLGKRRQRRKVDIAQSDVDLAVERIEAELMKNS